MNQAKQRRERARKAGIASGIARRSALSEKREYRQQTARRLRRKITPEQEAAMDYLDRRGFLFLGDYGFDNAAEIARSEKWKARRKK